MNEKTELNSKPKELSVEDIYLDLDIGHKVLKLAEKLGAAEAEVFMIKAAATDFSIEKNSVKFASSSTEFGMGIRVIIDKRLGFGFCTDLPHAEQSIKNALCTAKLGKELEFGFISESEHREISSIFDKTVLELTVADGLDRTHELISACIEIDNRIIIPGGGVGYGGGSVALLTSNNIELEYKGTGIYGGVSTILKDKTTSTGFDSDHSRRNDLDYSTIGKHAAKLALDGQNPKTVDSGEYPIIFTPEAISELLEFTVLPGLYGEQAMKGETFYSNRLGEQVAPENISLIDDGTLEKGINTAPIDDEGTPTQSTILVENGILKKYLFDRLSALEFNEISTGNANRAEGFGGGRSYKTTPKTKVQNFTIKSKSDTKPVETLISEIKNGLVIHELLGAHTANSASGDFSVNSPTLFKITNGELSAAGKQVMVSGNMGRLLERIRAIGNDYKNMGGGLTPVAFRIPSILIDDVKII